MNTIPLSGSYDPALVVLSVGVAVLATFSAFDWAARVRGLSGPDRYLWLLAGAGALGFGIWANHFVGMLALRLPVRVDYDLPGVLLSLVLAVAASWLPLSLASAKEIRRGPAIGAGAVTALGVVGMNLLGIEAMGLPGTLDFSGWGLALSGAVAWAAASGAVVLVGRVPSLGAAGIRTRLLAGSVLGGAIAGAHYLAVRSVQVELVVALSPEIRGLGLAGSTALAVGIGLTVAALAVVATLSVIRMTTRVTREVARLSFLMSGVALVVGSASFGVLYLRDVAQERRQLRESARSRAHFVEAAARFGGADPTSLNAEAVDSLLRGLPELYPGGWSFGEEGQFRVGRVAGDRVHFPVRGLDPVSLDSAVARPYRAGLETGGGDHVVDYEDGRGYLEAWEPVDFGSVVVVARIPLAELRAPFLRTGALAGGASVLLVLFGALLFVRASNPLVARLAEGDFLDALFRSIPQAIAIEGRDGRLSRVNPAFERLFGYDPEEVIGRKNDGFLVEDVDRDQIPLLLEEMEREGSATRELRGLRSDGSTFWVRASVARIESEGARIWSGEEITEVREARQAAERAERRYREMVESSSDLVFRIDAEGRWSYLNEAARSIYRTAPEDLLGRAVTERSPGGEDEDFLAALRNVLAGEEVQDLEVVQIDGRGASRHLSFSMRPLRDEEGEVVEAQGTARDVTERVRARESMTNVIRQASLIRSLINNVPDIIFFKDARGIYRGCNEAFGQLVGLSEEEIIGRTDEELFSSEDAELYRELDREVLRSREPIRNEQWVEYPDGEEALLDSQKTPFFSPGGELLGLIGVARDITERKRTEERVRKAAARADSPAGPSLETARRVLDRIEESEEAAEGGGEPVLQEVATFLREWLDAGPDEIPSSEAPASADPAGGGAAEEARGSRPESETDSESTSTERADRDSEATSSEDPLPDSDPQPVAGERAAAETESVEEETGGQETPESGSGSTGKAREVTGWLQIAEPPSEEDRDESDTIESGAPSPEVSGSVGGRLAVLREELGTLGLEEGWAEEIREGYLKEVPRHQRLLRDALEVDAASVAARTARALRSYAEGVRAPELGEIYRRLELAARRGALDEAAEIEVEGRSLQDEVLGALRGDGDER